MNLNATSLGQVLNKTGMFVSIKSQRKLAFLFGLREKHQNHLHVDLVF